MQPCSLSIEPARMVGTVTWVVTLTAIALLSLATTGCKDEEPTPVRPTMHLGLAEATTISAAGGLVRAEGIEELEGFQIDVPPGAFDEPVRFRIARKDASGLVAGKLIEPRSPLIEVDCNGRVAALPLEVTVPALIPEGHVPMGFYRDPESGSLEAIPVRDFDDDGVTLVTRHFSSFFVSSIDEEELSGVIESDFHPGLDNWHIPNLGSCITPIGNCSGMSLSSLWYFCERSEPRLYGHHDNDEGRGKTPGFWQDDVGAIKLCSVVQAEIKPSIDNAVMKIVRATKYQGRRLRKDALTFYSFAYAIAVSGKPQYLSVHRDNGAISHALLVHRVSPRTLHVVDPNHRHRDDITIKLKVPGDDLLRARFEPYDATLSNHSSTSALFDGFLFFGRTSLVRWSRITRMFTNLDAGSIGDRHFPDHEIRVLDKGTGDRLFALDPNAVNQVDQEELKVAVPKLRVRVSTGLGGEFQTQTLRSRVSIYRRDALRSPDTDGTIELHEGRNELGFLIEVRTSEGWRWAGFDWIEVDYEKREAKLVDDSEREWIFVFDESDGAVFRGAVGTLLANGVDSSQPFSNLDRVGTWTEHQKTKLSSYPGNVSFEYRASSRPVDLGSGMKGGSAGITITKFPTDAMARKQFDWEHHSDHQRKKQAQSRETMRRSGFGGTLEVRENEIVEWRPGQRPRDIGSGRKTEGEEILRTSLSITRLYKNCILHASAGSEVTVPAGTNPGRGRVPADPRALIAAACALIDEKRASDPGPEGFGSN